MKLDSQFFDKVRVKPEEDRRRRSHEPCCDWEGCERAGTHKAPMGRDREGQYFRFCIDHVREYNKSYNYFAGMDNDSIARFQKDAITGHRPTWSINSKGGSQSTDAPGGARVNPDADDPFGFMGEVGLEQGATGHVRSRRRLTGIEKKSFDVLDLDETADAKTIKTRYKDLVKKHHPDANGGDRGSEERLRQIIQAYNQLKSSGFC